MTINTARWNRIRYTLYAPVYDRLTRYFQNGRWRAVELLAPQPGERILIVGCGTGLDLPLLPDGVEVTAIDITPAMVRRTRERARESSRPVATAVMSAEALAFPRETFDCVLLHLVLSVVPDPVACAREAARVLKLGGRASIFDKFLPEGATPSRLRRMSNVVTNIVFSDINRRLQPIMQGASLTTSHQEPSVLGGTYQVAIAVKEESD